LKFWFFLGFFGHEQIAQKFSKMARVTPHGVNGKDNMAAPHKGSGGVYHSVRRYNGYDVIPWREVVRRCRM
jgi:hypothetical protein